MVCCLDRKDKKSKDPYLHRNLDPELEKILENMPSVSWWPIFLMMLVVIIIWGTIGFFPWAFQHETWPWRMSLGLDPDKAASFGDSFGFVNSLISSLALVGVIAAIWLQKQELMEQRKEMMITQWDLQGSKNQLASQARINLQATVLTALDGIANTAKNAQIFPGNEGPTAIAFVNEMRYIVIADVLENKDTNESATFILEVLESWRKLSSQISICNQIVFEAKRLKQNAKRLNSGAEKANPKDTDFGVNKVNGFKTFLKQKQNELSKLDAESINQEVITKLGDAAENLNEDTSKKIDLVTAVSNQHTNICRKRRSEILPSAQLEQD